MAKIGVDIGGTTVKFGLVDEKGKLLNKTSIPTKAKLGREDVISRMLAVIKQLKTEQVDGVGFGCPGYTDSEKGIVREFPNLSGWKNFKFAKRMEKELKLPVKIDNDANVFTLGEALYGAGKRHDIVLGITLGTGLGSGLVIDNKIYHGKRFAPELGHTVINFSGPECSCGNKGCFEEYVSARGIIRAHQYSSPHEMFLAAENKDSTARMLWEKTGYFLGLGLTNAIHAFNPEVIVIGGKIAHAWKYFYKPMLKEIKQRCVFDTPKIVHRKLEDVAGVLGAAGLFL